MEPVSFTAKEVEGMVRRTLQQHCKKLSIKANGKNVEMKQRLIEYLQEYQRQHSIIMETAEEDEEQEEPPVREVEASTSAEDDSQSDGRQMTIASVDDVGDDPLSDSVSDGVDSDLAPAEETEAEENIMTVDEGSHTARAYSREEFPLSGPTEQSKAQPVVEEAMAVEEDITMQEDMIMEEDMTREEHVSMAKEDMVIENAVMEDLPSDEVTGRTDREEPTIEDVNMHGAADDLCSSASQQDEETDSGLDSTVTEDDIVPLVTDAVCEVLDCPRLSACADSAMDLEEEDDATPTATTIPVMWSPAVQRAVNDSGELCLSGEHRPFSLLESPMQSPIRSRRSGGAPADSPEPVPVHIMDLKIQAASPVQTGMPACTPLQAAAPRSKPKVTIRPTRQLTAPAIKLPSALAGLKKTSTHTKAAAEAAVPAKRRAPGQERHAGTKRKARDFDAIHERQFSKLKSITDCVPTKQPEKKKRRMEERPSAGSHSGAAASASQPLEAKNTHVTPCDSENTVRSRSSGRRVQDRPRTSSSKRAASRQGAISQGGSTKRVQPLGDRKNILSASRPAAVKSRNLSSSSGSGKRSSTKLGGKPRVSIAERSLAAAKEKARKLGYTSKNGATVR